METSLTGKNHFHYFSRIIKVEDIATPVFGMFAQSQTIAEVGEDLFERYSEEKLEFIGQVGLVKRGNQAVGWFATDHTSTDDCRPIGEIMYPIEPGQIISAETPLVEVLELFSNPNPRTFFFVLKGAKINAVFHYGDLAKMPFRLCLFALLTHLELLALQILERNGPLSIANLPRNRKQQAKMCFKRRGYGDYSEEGENQYKNQRLLLNCTTCEDKFNLLNKISEFRPEIPVLDEEGLIRDLCDLRNNIAHVDSDLGTDWASALLAREELGRFFKLTLALERQMEELLDNWVFWDRVWKKG
jgi:hypothetical protein